MAEAGNQGNGTDMTSKVKILYFASLREAVGCSGEELELPAGVGTVGALRSHLAARGEGWQALAAGRNVRAALNQKMAAADSSLDGGDEVAFFTPVTGG
jgi:molybdopterin synthase sulfur carrier subunit